MKKRILSCFMALALCLTLLPTAALAADEHQHCVCGKTEHVDISGHTGESQITFDKWLTSTGYNTLDVGEGTDLDGTGQKPVDGKYVLPAGDSTADNYYLKKDVTIDLPIQITGNVTICLNGHTIKSTAEGKPVFEIVSGGTLTLTNCGSRGEVTSAYNGGGVEVNGGTFNLYGGSITKNTADNGGGVYVHDNGEFNMYGGKITGNTAVKGGGVKVDGGKFNLYGGEIADNKSEGQNSIGGGVYVYGGTFTMSGGTISGNTAVSTNGADGGVGVYNDAEFTMSGGTISGNQAKGQGGGVGVHNRGTFTMNGGTIGGTIDGEANKAAEGGGVYVGNNGKFTMNGKKTSVSGNTATNGGGVYVYSGTFQMNDGTIGGATAAAANTATNGGGVYVKGGKFEMNGPETSVSGNTATTNGGGVYVEGGTFTMHDGTIGGTIEGDANTANQDGGGVYVSSGTFTMSDGRITGNHNNGVFVSNSANTTFTVSGAPTVMGNTRESADSNVFLAGSQTITIGGTLNEGASIGVTRGAYFVIANNVNEDYSSIFFSDNTQYKVEYDKTDETNHKLVLAKKSGGTTTPPTHKHEWTYTATGAIITATCKGEGCDVSGSVAITKPANLTYDGTKKLAMVEESENWKSVYSQDITITYWESVDGSDTYTNMKGDAPTKVGKYKASITVGGQTASVEYEIIAGTTEKIPVTKITLSPASPVLTVGQTQAMTVVIEPRTATDQNLTWKSSDNSVATVENGTVTAKAPGTAEITATAVDGSGKSATCKVTVTDGTTPSQPGGGTTGGGTTGGTTGGSTGGTTGGGSSSGGSSSSDRDSHDSNPVVKTETKNNADGSTTKTETRRDGSVTQTTTAKDGSTSKTETKKDGSSVTENKAADGSTGTVKTDKNGQTEAAAKVSAKAVEDAKKNGEAVKAPVEVEASRNSSTAPTVKVELPKGTGETKVEIPVSNVKPGTVAVLVHPDGTEEIVKNSIPTEDGIQLTVDGNATVKIIDNSKDFIDTRNHWAEDAIDFVSARGLVNGMTDTIYAPNNSTTRAQLWTILARQNDANLNGGATWFEKAQNWAKTKGVSDGANPNAAINRAQMVTMLWRAVGQPAAGGAARFTDVPADAYYAGAVSWAVENGITTGVGGGRFDPAATCTRAQIAAFLTRLYAEK